MYDTNGHVLAATGFGVLLFGHTIELPMIATAGAALCFIGAALVMTARKAAKHES